MDDIGDGAPMDETPSNTSLLSFDLGSGLTPKMSWLASRTRDGLGPSVEINQCVGCIRHYHAIEQASRRWR